MTQTYEEFYEKNKDDPELRACYLAHNILGEGTAELLENPNILKLLRAVAIICDGQAQKQLKIKDVELVEQDGKNVIYLTFTPSIFLGHKAFRQEDIDYIKSEMGKD